MSIAIGRQMCSVFGMCGGVWMLASGKKTDIQHLAQERERERDEPQNARKLGTSGVVETKNEQGFVRGAVTYQRRHLALKKLLIFS